MVLIDEVLPVIGHRNIAAHACVRKVPSARMLIQIAGHGVVRRRLVPQAPPRLAAAAVLRMVHGPTYVPAQLQVHLPACRNTPRYPAQVTAAASKTLTDILCCRCRHDTKYCRLTAD